MSYYHPEEYQVLSANENQELSDSGIRQTMPKSETTSGIDDSYVADIDANVEPETVSVLQFKFVRTHFETLPAELAPWNH